MLEALLVSAAVTGLMAATLNDFGMAWDEGYAVECAERIGEWFARVTGDNSAAARAWAPSPTVSLLEPRAKFLKRAGVAAESSPWDRETLRFFWPFAREAPIGHPPFFAVLARAGWALCHNLLGPPGSYRFGAAALFAATAGVMYGVIAARYGRAAGATAALGLVTMPRVFAHAHLALFDAPTLCLWFLAASAFLKAVETPGGSWAVAFGVLWGCAAATKFTGWLLPVPLAAWGLIYRERRAARVLLAGGLFAAAVVYALIPTWWAEPVGGLTVFLRSNLTRREHSPIPTLFFGTVYPFALPWYNTMVWTAVVVPPVTLALGVAGVAGSVKGWRGDRFGALLALCWLFFMTVRALPAAPGHDAERQILPSFAFLAGLAGVGLAGVVARVPAPGVKRALAWGVAAAAVTAGGWETWRYHPVQLSYYNALIGGLSGAYRAGMEPTYYWDAFTPEARAWVDAHTDPRRPVIFAYPVATFEYLHHWGLLKPSPVFDRKIPPQWLVVQNRPGVLRTYPNLRVAAYLLAHARPAYVVTAPAAPDVPLIAVYAVQDVAAAEEAIRHGPEFRAEP